MQTTIENDSLDTSAKLYGEPLLNLPHDLYIPPEALEIFLDAFEGPMDLLLYLIKKQNFNILDIPVAEVTNQYLIYIENIRKKNLELAADYLVIAAMLIEIKSRMLLPPKKSEEENENDPRAELVKKLLIYEQIKDVAKEIDNYHQIDRDIFESKIFFNKINENLLPKINTEELQRAWMNVLRRAKLNEEHIINRQILSVREHMSLILRRLRSTKFVEFFELFESKKGVSVLIVNFIALLELSKDNLIEITQGESFSPIYIKLVD